jgi:hypothetical protein
LVYPFPGRVPQRGRGDSADFRSLNLAESKKDGTFDGGFDYSTETDTEFDIISELKVALEDIEKAFQQGQKDDFSEKISYLKFLVRELDDSLSGQYEDLRRRRFITKRST